MAPRTTAIPTTGDWLTIDSSETSHVVWCGLCCVGYGPFGTYQEANAWKRLHRPEHADNCTQTDCLQAALAGGLCPRHYRQAERARKRASQ